MWGSGMATALMITNASTKIPMAMNSSGATAPIVVDAVTSPISMPTKSGVQVPASELSEPPVCTSWLPLLPPPPRRLSMGFTTVLSMQTQKPHVNAPSR